MLNWVAAPRDSKGFEPHYRLLAALSGRDLQSLQQHIEAVPLARADARARGGCSRGTPRSPLATNHILVE